MGVSKTNIDMLNGPLGRKILRFAIPIALSSIFQQMFNLADVAVVGLLAINVFLDVFSGALSGMGKSLPPALTCMAGVCGIRILWVIFVFPKYKSFASLMVVYPISWVITIAVIMGIYFYNIKRQKF